MSNPTERELAEMVRKSLPPITPVLRRRDRLRLAFARAAVFCICVAFVLAWWLVAPLLDPDARRKAKARIDA